MRTDPEPSSPISSDGESGSLYGRRSSNVTTNGTRRRSVIYPLGYSTMRKTRRWPLVLRFVKGAIHGAIILPVAFHALFTMLVVCLHTYGGLDLGLPSPITPSLSIVVGLMLVFRNQTSYNRFWDGRNAYTTIITSVRNLTRSILSCSINRDPATPLTEAEKADIDRTVRILIAIPSSVKNSLRSEWGAAWAPIDTSSQDINKYTGAVTPRLNPEYATLLPLGLKGHESSGLSLPLELTFFIESFIHRGQGRGWFHAPQASQLTVQLNMLVDAFGRMETIRSTPFPIAILIHQKQVLALFGAVLPFALVGETGWWSVPIVSLVIFTLYGIEGIGSQLEDPFGYERNDIKCDAIVQDARTEMGVMLGEWRRVNSNEVEGGAIRSEMFMADLG